jgi:tetratricopeptide (TPR) repeat protein
MESKHTDCEIERLLREKQWPALRSKLLTKISSVRRGGDREHEARMHELLALACSVLGDHPAAVRAAEEALEVRKLQRVAIESASALSEVPITTVSQPVEDRGIREAIGLFRDVFDGRPPIEVNKERCCAAMAFAALLTSLGNTQEARAVIEQSMQWCREDALAWYQWSLLEIKSATHRQDEDLNLALKSLESAFVLRQQQGAVTWKCLHDLANLYLKMNRTWEAKEMFRMAFLVAQEGSEAPPVELATSLQAFHQGKHPKPRRLTHPGFKLPGGMSH